MTDTTDGAAAVIAAGLVDTSQTPDVTYAHGGLTGVNGHPKEVYESLANGFYYPQTDAQRALVIGGHKAEGRAYWEIANVAELHAVLQTERGEECGRRRQASFPIFPPIRQ